MLKDEHLAHLVKSFALIYTVQVKFEVNDKKIKNN